MNIETNVVIWQNSGPSGVYSVHVLNVDGTNTFTYNATSSEIFVQIRQAGTYYLDNIRMYRTYEDTMFVSGYKMDVAYRYGYNTQERVPEIQKDHYTAPYWEYDPRVVHRWNRDPKPVPSISPYAINQGNPDRKSTRLNSSHVRISYAVFCLKKKTDWGRCAVNGASRLPGPPANTMPRTRLPVIFNPPTRPV